MPEINRAELEKLFTNVSNEAVKHWLKVSGREHTAHDTDEFYDLLLKLANNGKLDKNTLEQIALEVEENGDKIIYFKQIDNFNYLKSRQFFENIVNKCGLQLSERPNKSLPYPKKPTLNYAWWSENEIRIKYSETQIDRIFDYENQRFVDKPVTKFAIAIVDLNSGIMQIRFDQAENVHIHKDPTTGESKAHIYEEYYVSQFSKILANCNFELYDLSNAVEWIVRQQPRVFRIPREGGRTGANSRQSYSRPFNYDIRDDPAYQAMSAADRDLVHESLSGYWLPDQSNGEISREFFMQIKRKTSMIRFLKDCLASEVNYAINRIREV